MSHIFLKIAATRVFKKSLVLSIATFCILLSLTSRSTFAMPRGGYVLAKTSYKEAILTDDFDDTYKKIQAEYSDVVTHLPEKYQKDRLKTATSRPYEKPEYAKLRQRFFELQELKKIYDPVYDLKETLNDMYLKGAKDQHVDHAALNSESLRLAIGLMDRIALLKKHFKSFFIPTVHNMLISVGLKHRGACKHWAQDLLEYLQQIHRDYFFATWGEANPHKVNEHNVAVLYPKWGGFDDGILVDPWRTSGRPFWLHIREDRHYKWHKWALYEVY